MNADGSAGVDAVADLGATAPALPWIGIGLLIAGAIFLAAGALLVIGAIRRHPDMPAGEMPATPHRSPTALPARDRAEGKEHHANHR